MRELLNKGMVYLQYFLDHYILDGLRVIQLSRKVEKTTKRKKAKMIGIKVYGETSLGILDGDRGLTFKRNTEKLDVKMEVNCIKFNANWVFSLKMVA
jgi:hypothetical protein